MILKIEVYEINKWQHTLYVECNDSIDAEETKQIIRAYVTEFKTYCNINNKPYNVYHMINWIKKYKGLDFVGFPKYTTLRIDM